MASWPIGPVGAGRRQLTWFDRTGKLLGTLGAPDENELVAPSLSPDGRRVAAHRTVQDNTDIWIFDAARTTRFTFDAGRDLFPIWSPDGDHVAFDSNRSGHRYFYQKRSDLAGAEVLLLESPEDKVLNDWSPDGRSLLYVHAEQSQDGRRHLVCAVVRRPPTHLIRARPPFWNEQVSFRLMVVGSRTTRTNRVRTRFTYGRFRDPAGSSRSQRQVGFRRVGGPDGRELYYIAPDGTLMAAAITMKGAALEPGTPVALFQTRIWGGGTNATQGQQYDVAPDGRFLINVAIEDVATAPITLLLNWKPTP